MRTFVIVFASCRFGPILRVGPAPACHEGGACGGAAPRAALVAVVIGPAGRHGLHVFKQRAAPHTPVSGGDGR